MPTRILASTYATKGTRLYFDRDDLYLSPRQLIVWVSLTPVSVSCPDPTVHPYFPAVIDTAFGGSFFINGRHVESWAGLRLGSRRLGIFTQWDLRFTGAHQHLYGYPVPLFDGRLWLHREKPPQLDENPAERARVYANSIELIIEQSGIAVMLRNPGKYVTKDPNYGPALAHTIKAIRPDVISFIRGRPPQPVIGMQLLEENEFEFDVNTQAHTFTLSSDRTDLQLPPECPSDS